ncbi:MAG: UDP-N-acetylglucosamine 2-epimerase (hydrolyzing) [Ramlibacter sp.]|nr:UDP-N-acetylglucosamine 2-epimerase (hydrolyzing) [Ramlibacter sp.]
MSTTPARRLVYLTGTRADFGLFQSTLQRVAATPGIDLKIAVTGMHLSREHGETINEVRASGLAICAEIPLDMDNRTGAGMAFALADCLRGVTQMLAREQPDFLVVLGDRGEMLAGAIAALHTGVGCVHIHGGERSGTIDEPMRHAISKLATYHFVATQESRERLIRMGEDDARVFVTGAPGLDGLAELGCVPRGDCIRAVGLASDAPFVLAMFHPVVQQAHLAREQTQAVMTALKQVGLPVVWLDPNADAGSLEILSALGDLALSAGSVRLGHLPRAQFAAALRHCAVLVGNSSAGIIEAATFGTPVVNIGDRQRLRERSANIADVAPQAAPVEAIVRAQIAHGLWPCDNPWGDGRAGERIAALLAALPAGPHLLEKSNSF